MSLRPGVRTLEHSTITVLAFAILVFYSFWIEKQAAIWPFRVSFALVSNMLTMQVSSISCRARESCRQSWKTLRICGLAIVLRRIFLAREMVVWSQLTESKWKSMRKVLWELLSWTISTLPPLRRLPSKSTAKILLSKIRCAYFIKDYQLLTSTDSPSSNSTSFCISSSHCERSYISLYSHLQIDNLSASQGQLTDSLVMSCSMGKYRKRKPYKTRKGLIWLIMLPLFILRVFERNVDSSVQVTGWLHASCRRYSSAQAVIYSTVGSSLILLATSLMQPPLSTSKKSVKPIFLSLRIWLSGGICMLGNFVWNSFFLMMPSSSDYSLSFIMLVQTSLQEARIVYSSARLMMQFC